MKFIKEIDSLRAFAVLGVIFSHWAQNTLAKIPFGGIGVHFFFVLSGFLITKILLESRIKTESENGSSFRLIKNFYIRRALRIFPIYYLVIVVLLVFRQYTTVNFHDALIYCLTYTANFYFIKIGNWEGQISHLWSLAVEEQFYLIWPWFIILINRKYLLHVIFSFIIIGLASQYYFSNIPKADLMPNASFDGFGLGALLAWVLIFKKDFAKRFYKIVRILGFLAFILFSVKLFVPTVSINIPSRFLTFLFSIWILTYVVLNAESGTLKFKFIFQNPILLFLGKISYGMYLYHFIIPSLLNTILINKYFNPHLPDFLYVQNLKWLFFFENFFLLILISWLSFIFIEKRFLNLKNNYTN
jgi:peptidoglycan/LPS O-acetylase OafA/YrhL